MRIEFEKECLVTKVSKFKSRKNGKEYNTITILDDSGSTISPFYYGDAEKLQSLKPLTAYTIKFVVNGDNQDYRLVALDIL